MHFSTTVCSKHFEACVTLVICRFLNEGGPEFQSKLIFQSLIDEPFEAVKEKFSLTTKLILLDSLL